MFIGQQSQSTAVDCHGSEKKDTKMLSIRDENLAKNWNENAFIDIQDNQKDGCYICRPPVHSVSYTCLQRVGDVDQFSFQILFMTNSLTSQFVELSSLLENL